MSNNVEEIFNYKEINSKLSIGGQPEAKHFLSLKQAGFDTIFQIHVKEADYSVADEAFHVKNNDMHHTSMSMSYSKPVIQDAIHFFQVLDNHTEGKLYIHCAAGFCTSALLVLYQMIRHKLSFEEASRQYAVANWTVQDHWRELLAEVHEYMKGT